jgi:hypothetical protein
MCACSAAPLFVSSYYRTLNFQCLILYSYNRAPSNIVKTLKTILRASRDVVHLKCPQKIADKTVCPYSSIDRYHFRPTFSLDSTFKVQSLFLKTIFTRSTAPSHYRTYRLINRSMPQTIGLKGKDDLPRFIHKIEDLFYWRLTIN